MNSWGNFSTQRGFYKQQQSLSAAILKSRSAAPTQARSAARRDPASVQPASATQIVLLPVSAQRRATYGHAGCEGGLHCPTPPLLVGWRTISGALPRHWPRRSVAPSRPDRGLSWLHALHVGRRWRYFSRTVQGHWLHDLGDAGPRCEILTGILQKGAGDHFTSSNGRSMM